MNERMTKKDINLLKGALRRVFARSELHHKIIKLAIVDADEVPAEIRQKRKRVKTWCKCPSCKEYKAKSDLVVDHIDPLIPLNSTFSDMSLDTVIDRLWCKENNLQGICYICHDKKTKLERLSRRKLK